MKLHARLAAWSLAALTGLAFAQSKEIRIAHVYDKTGPLEAYAKQTQNGLMLGFSYATGGRMEVLGCIGAPPSCLPCLWAAVRLKTRILQPQRHRPAKLSLKAPTPLVRSWPHG